MTVHPIPDPTLGNTSYLVEVGHGLAVAVDPRRDVDAHLRLADRLGVRLVASLETHLHADFLSGSRELAALGCDVVAAADARLAFPHVPLDAGTSIRYGDVAVRALATPGHTPEHVAYAIEVDGQVTAVFTGGSLIFGGAGRTDLTGDERTVDLARAQWRSLRALAEMPDAVEVHPTHGAGSFCSTGPATAVAGTIGDERRRNPLLGIDDEETFLRTLLAGFGSYPPYFRHLRDVNRSGPRLLRDMEPPRPIHPTQAAEVVERGAVLVDGRPIGQWAQSHPAGAVSIEVRPAFSSWLGWVVPFGTPVVLLTDEDRLREATRQARGIGYEVLGWIDGGIEAWTAAGLPVAGVEVIGADEALRRQRAGATLLDVRQRSEVETSGIPGAVHVELGEIVAGRTPEAREVIAFCGHGERSATAASLLEARGLRVANLDGGLEAWEQAGLPLHRSA